MADKGGPEPAVTSRAPGAPKTVDDVATEIVNHINANEGAAVFALFADPMAQMRPVDKTKMYVEKVHSAFGRLGAKTRLQGSAASDGVYRVSAEHGACLLELHLTPRGQVIGMTVRGASGT